MTTRKRVASLVSLPDRFYPGKISHAILWTGGRVGLITSAEHGAKENTFLSLSGLCVCVCGGGSKDPLGLPGRNLVLY